MINLDSGLKNRDIIIFLRKVCIVKTIVSLVVMYGFESWTTKKVEHCRINAFELWCWRKLLRVLCSARRPNLSILKEINPEYSLEGLTLKLKFHTLSMWCEELTRKSLDAGKVWRQKEGMTEDGMFGWHHWLEGHEFEQTLGDGEGQGSLECCSPWSHKESDVTEQLNKNNLLSMRFNYSLIILTQKTQCLSRNVLILLRLISWCRPWFIPRMQLFMFQILYII